MIMITDKCARYNYLESNINRQVIRKEEVYICMFPLHKNLKSHEVMSHVDLLEQHCLKVEHELA